MRSSIVNDIPSTYVLTDAASHKSKKFKLALSLQQLPPSFKICIWCQDNSYQQSGHKVQHYLYNWKVGFCIHKLKFLLNHFVKLEHPDDLSIVHFFQLFVCIMSHVSSILVSLPFEYDPLGKHRGFTPMHQGWKLQHKSLSFFSAALM